jgi:hypothetical protein
MKVTKENYEESVARLEDLLAKEEVFNTQIEELAEAICVYEEKEFPIDEAKEVVEE